MTYDLCAIGNALVDIIVSTDEAFLSANNIVKGTMVLIDDATLAALYKNAGAAVEMSSGGSAANTLAGFASLGGACGFMGKTGRDQFGEVFAHDLHAQQVRFTTPPSRDLPTGRCLSLVTPDAQRSMMTCLGAAGEVDFGDVDAELVQSSSITYLEGYLYDKPAAKEAFHKTAKLAHDAGRKLALTLSDVFCVTRHNAAFREFVASDVDILFANENELKALYGTQDLKAAIDAARAQVDLAVTTRSEQGAIIAASEQTHEVPAHPVTRVVDTTGAGDSYAAGFLYGLTHGKSLPEAARIGAIAAAEIISHYGPRPQKKLSDLI